MIWIVGVRVIGVLLYLWTHSEYKASQKPGIRYQKPHSHSCITTTLTSSRIFLIPPKNVLLHFKDKTCLPAGPVDCGLADVSLNREIIAMFYLQMVFVAIYTDEQGRVQPSNYLANTLKLSYIRTRLPCTDVYGTIHCHTLALPLYCAESDHGQF